VIRRFGYYFVRTGRVSDEIGGILTSARSMRGEADYDAFSDLSKGEAAKLIKKAHRFIEAVEKEILTGR